jgi:hypothetical protein
MKCTYLKELEIRLPSEWRECVKIIGNTCIDLEKLTIFPSRSIVGPSLDDSFQELHEIEFLASSSLYKSTLTHITLNGYNIYGSKAEYLTISQNSGILNINNK